MTSGSSVAAARLMAALVTMAQLLQPSLGFVDRCDRGEIMIYSPAVRAGRDAGPGCYGDAGADCPDEETFVTSPGWPRPYPEDARCRYKFVAGRNEKVRLNFLAFNVEGLGPSCEKDFLDVYTELEQENASLLHSPLLGRFCGHSLASVPRTVVSLHSVLVLDFYTDGNTQKVYNNDNHMAMEVALGFKAQYSFVPKADYEPGPRLLAYSGNCSFLMETSSVDIDGVINSPGYPGLYPDNLHCNYLFRGFGNQRVRVHFKELDIYEIHAETFGEAGHTISSCPIDSVRIYDSDQRLRQIYSDFCGQKAGLTVVSTGSRMRLEFITGAGRIPRSRTVTSADLGELQRKGFRLRYNISSEYLRIDRGLRSNHLTGTECDFLIESAGNSHDRFQFPSVRGGRLCRVFFQGVHNLQRSEMSLLRIDGMARITAGRRQDGRCPGLAGHLKVYARGQGADAVPDADFCQAVGEASDGRGGSLGEPQEFRSSGPQLFLVFDTRHLETWQLAPAFIINYRFVPDFGIPGHQPNEDDCAFEYVSGADKAHGRTNSPFFNPVTKAHYPHNTTCSYRFVATEPNQRVRIRFTHFYVEDFFIEELGNDKKHHTVGSYVPCAGDRVEIYERYESPKNSGRFRLEKILTYCGTSIPGPYVTQFDTQELLVLFHSTWDKWAHPEYGKRTASGFQIEYDFPVRTSLFSNKFDVCGGNISSDMHGGVIQVPKNEQATYQPDLICEWHIYPSQPGNQVFVQFPEFHLEGSTKSCSMAVLRMYNGDSHVPSSEVCGADNGIPAFYGSGSEHVRIRLLTTAGSRGGKGFKFSWTEALKIHPGTGHCPGFQCKRTRHCIDHRLECNRLPNCGSRAVEYSADFDKDRLRWKNHTKHERDNSDEEINSEKCHSIYAKATGPTEAAYQLLHVGIGVIVTVLLLIAIVAFVLYREHRKSSSKKQAQQAASDMLDLSAMRQLMPETGDRVDGGFATTATRNLNGHHSYSLQRQQQYPQHQLQHQHRGYVHSRSTSTLTREKMQKISIV
ncbi:hypothetical protein BOX15_Mlig012127g3 [Macrostomum lignano]|uniref:CUB domain-containing protein n=1 Tax=Macrostomum lignano TaxID=282301 RepID=A0A267GY95_9PLAT|nr:hypothetical protein BOX15_Mlig012127g3 [Macrostomum lignano]